MPRHIKFKADQKSAYGWVCTRSVASVNANVAFHWRLLWLFVSASGHSPRERRIHCYLAFFDNILWSILWASIPSQASIFWGSKLWVSSGCGASRTLTIWTIALGPRRRMGNLILAMLLVLRPIPPILPNLKSAKRHGLFKVPGQQNLGTTL